jgi:hypothetical protein
LGAICGVNLQTHSTPPAGTIIRFTAVYAKFEHIQEKIVRCANHITSKEFNNESTLSIKFPLLFWSYL